jgi:hypothetical protein
MRSTADALRAATRAAAAAESPAERVAQAFRLGDEDLRAYAEARGITLRAARLDIVRRRAAGRRPSASADPTRA